MTAENYGIRNICFIIVCLLISTASSFPQQTAASSVSDDNASFIEQQKLLNAQLLDYIRQQMNVLYSMRNYVGRELFDSAGEYDPDIPQYQQLLRRYRGDDEFNYYRARLDMLRLRTIEAESKKNELKMKVLKQNNQLPDWWTRAEEEFAGKRRQAVQSGLGR